MIINPKIAIEKGWIIRPGGIRKDQIQPNGIDLTVNYIQIPHCWDPIPVVKNKILPEFEGLMFSYNCWELNERYPFYLINCNETITIPENVCAMIFKRSTLNRMGCQLQSGLWDSGFVGSVGFTIWPSIPIIMRPNDRLCQIVFITADSGVLYNGVYQNQKGH